jgi:hypothetical protein
VSPARGLTLAAARVNAAEFCDDFDAEGLDTEVWIPHYLPQWSSRARSAATYEVADSELRLATTPEQGLWCAEGHEESLRVSGVQSGVSSCEVGSTVGQQPFRDGQVVRERQPTQWGWTPRQGRSGDGRPRAAAGRRPRPGHDRRLAVAQGPAAASRC